MPCGHGRSRRGANKRSIDRNSYKQFQVPELALRNYQERWYICTIIFLPHNENWKSLPFLPALQGADKVSHCISGSPSDVNGAERLSPQEETGTQVDLTNKITDYAKMECGSLTVVNISEEPENINKLAPPLKNLSSTFRHKSVVQSNSSSSVNDNLSTLGSDFLVTDASKVDKTVKRSSKKKGKKKGKQYKRNASKKISTESDVRFHEDSCNASVHKNSLNKFSSYVGHHVSDDKTVTPIHLVINSKEEKDDTEVNNCLTSLVSCTSYSDEMDDSEPIASFQRLSTSSGSTINQAQEIILSTSGKNNKDAQCKLNSNLHQSACSIDIGSFTASVVDSSLDGWNGDISENCSEDIEMGLTFKEEGRPNSSEGEIVPVSVKTDASISTMTLNLCDMNTGIWNDGDIRNGDWSSDVLDACNSIERAECSSQACSSNDFHPVISGKKGRRARKMTGSGSLEGANRYGPVNPQGWKVRDNSNHIWQKVQKIDSKKSFSESNNHLLASIRDDGTSKMKMKPDTNVRQKGKNGRNNRYPSSCEADKKGSCQMASSAVKSSQVAKQSAAENQKNNVKSRFSSVPKQTNCCFKSDSNTDGSKNQKALKNRVCQKEGFQSSPTLNGPEEVSTASGLLISAPPCLVNTTYNSNRCQPQPVQETDISLQEAISSNNVNRTICNKTAPAAYNNIGQLQNFNLFDQTAIRFDSESSNSSLCFIDMHEDTPFTCNEDSPTTKSEAESSTADSRNLCNDPEAALQKLISLGWRDTVVSDMAHMDSLKMDVANEGVLDKSGSKNAKVNISSLNKKCLLSISPDELSCSRPTSRGTESSSSESFGSTINLIGHHNSTEDIHGLSNLYAHQVKNQAFNEFETNLEQIRQAVLDAYKLQTSVECIQSVTSSPIADVEKFLHSVSPIISQTCHWTRCTTCPQEQLIGHSLCWHQIPNISLRSLWRWYEEPSCFGLEVKAQEYCHSKASGKDSFEFNAYFVPYLSAVQLFGKSMSMRYTDPGGGETISSGNNRASSPVSFLGSLPIFSMLLPPPEESTSCLLESTSIQCDQRNSLIDGELIFEYFEPEQPPRRRPLYEKIKDLIRGYTSPNSRIFGDPQMLESVNLHDLHPASWFCVAWYPIYRIPDGNFRAAFLTYHSLGCLVHRSDSSSGSHALGSIVSPVVGMQTYNIKGESWFQLRDPDSKVELETQYRNPSEVLKERLQTLKETATVMATAVVSKGSQRSVNHHPDYEFFLSRGQ